jgi:hypothetical protein
MIVLDTGLLIYTIGKVEPEYWDDDIADSFRSTFKNTLSQDKQNYEMLEEHDTAFRVSHSAIYANNPDKLSEQIEKKIQDVVDETEQKVGKSMANGKHFKADFYYTFAVAGCYFDNEHIRIEI